MGIHIGIVLARVYDEGWFIHITDNGTVVFKEPDGTIIEGDLDDLASLQSVLGCSYAYLGNTDENGCTDAVRPYPPPGMYGRTPLLSVEFLRAKLKKTTVTGHQTNEVVGHYQGAPSEPDDEPVVALVEQSIVQRWPKRSFNLEVKATHTNEGNVNITGVRTFRVGNEVYTGSDVYINRYGWYSQADPPPYTRAMGSRRDSLLDEG